MPDRSGWNRQPGFDLSGKRALVVGAETAAGAAVTEAFQEAGASVIAVTTGDAGPDAWDVRDPAAIRSGMERLRDGGAPSILVTAFDASFAAPIIETTDEQYRRTIGTIVDGTYYTFRAFLRALPADSTDARIICLTTVFGERGIDNISAYAAAHGAVHNLVRTLAQELGDRNGATVNGIATGWMTDTPSRGPDDIAQNRLMRFVPMRRFGEPDEVAPLAVLLASPAAGYISGQILHVDGGITQHL